MGKQCDKLRERIIRSHKVAKSFYGDLFLQKVDAFKELIIKHKQETKNNNTLRAVISLIDQEENKRNEMNVMMIMAGACELLDQEAIESKNQQPQ